MEKIRTISQDDDTERHILEQFLITDEERTFYNLHRERFAVLNFRYGNIVLSDINRKTLISKQQSPFNVTPMELIITYNAEHHNLLFSDFSYLMIFKNVTRLMLINETSFYPELFFGQGYANPMLLTLQIRGFNFMGFLSTTGFEKNLQILSLRNGVLLSVDALQDISNFVCLKILEVGMQDIDLIRVHPHAIQVPMDAENFLFHLAGRLDYLEILSISAAILSAEFNISQFAPRLKKILVQNTRFFPDDVLTQNQSVLRLISTLPSTIESVSFINMGLTTFPEKLVDISVNIKKIDLSNASIPLMMTSTGMIIKNMNFSMIAGLYNSFSNNIIIIDSRFQCLKTIDLHNAYVLKMKFVPHFDKKNQGKTFLQSETFPSLKKINVSMGFMLWRSGRQSDIKNITLYNYALFPALREVECYGNILPMQIIDMKDLNLYEGGYAFRYNNAIEDDGNGRIQLLFNGIMLGEGAKSQISKFDFISKLSDANPDVWLVYGDHDEDFYDFYEDHDDFLHSTQFNEEVEGWENLTDEEKEEKIEEEMERVNKEKRNDFIMHNEEAWKLRGERTIKQSDKDQQMRFNERKQFYNELLRLNMERAEQTFEEMFREVPVFAGARTEPYMRIYSKKLTTQNPFGQTCSICLELFTKDSHHKKENVDNSFIRNKKKSESMSVVVCNMTQHDVIMNLSNIGKYTIDERKEISKEDQKKIDERIAYHHTHFIHVGCYQYWLLGNSPRRCFMDHDQFYD